MNQKELAKKSMVLWLSHSSELGKKPTKIQCKCNFYYLGLKYYMFKFKKRSFDSKWLLGVCGGYDENETEHCGHVFSEFREYNASNEKKDGIKMIEMIRQYWMNIAKELEI